MLNFQKSILLFSTSKMAERTQFSYAETVTCEMPADQKVWEHAFMRLPRDLISIIQEENLSADAEPAVERRRPSATCAEWTGCLTA